MHAYLGENGLDARQITVGERRHGPPTCAACSDDVVAPSTNQSATASRRNPQNAARQQGSRALPAGEEGRADPSLSKGKACRGLFPKQTKIFKFSSSFFARAAYRRKINQFRPVARAAEEGASASVAHGVSFELLLHCVFNAM
jgi:hypothetical protein